MMCATIMYVSDSNRVLELYAPTRSGVLRYIRVAPNLIVLRVVLCLYANLGGGEEGRLSDYLIMPQPKTSAGTRNAQGNLIVLLLLLLSSSQIVEFQSRRARYGTARGHENCTGV